MNVETESFMNSETSFSLVLMGSKIHVDSSEEVIIKLNAFFNILLKGTEFLSIIGIAASFAVFLSHILKTNKD